MRNTIVITDDSKFNRELLRDQLAELSDYTFVLMEDGRKALDYIYANRNKIAALTLDMVMPVLDGLGVLRELNEKNMMDDFPVIVITSEQPSDVVEECFSYGISDFIRKPAKKEIIVKRVSKLVSLYHQRNEFKEMLEHQTQAMKSQYAILKKQADKMASLNDTMITMLGTVVEIRNRETSDHVANVKNYTKILATQVAEDYPEYDLNPETIKRITSASGLHDLGKAFIPERIILKPGKLDPDEIQMMKSHTLRGCEVLEQLNMDWDPSFYKICYDICRSHHEKYDGKGYPDGLVGDDIPISAQIVGIADQYDVLTSERSYKQAYSGEKAFQMIIQGECGMISPKIMESFRKVKGQFEHYLSDAILRREE